jgi:GNAT superfamily N-acetyltransferase
MSGTTPTGRGAAPAPSLATASWRVRRAARDDVAAVAAAVGELLAELGGTPAHASEMQAAAQTLLDDRDAGALLVAEANGAIVGLLGASWQVAIHVPGRYALIQELWVHPAWRGRSIGAELLSALCALARERQIARVEVGLPDGRFAGLRATEEFYRANGFRPLGARARRTLS